MPLILIGVVFIWIFFKTREFNKIISVISFNYILFLFYILLIDRFEGYKIFILISMAAVFFLSCIYILTGFSLKFERILNAFRDLSEKKLNAAYKLKMSGNFKKLVIFHDKIWNDLTSVIKTVDAFSKDLSSIMTKLTSTSEDVKNGIAVQEAITNNFNTSLDILGKSIETGARGLDETRVMFKNNSDNFNILFDRINTIFVKNQEMQKENKNMEKFSISAIQFSLDLNEITKNGTNKIDKIIGFIEDFVKSVKKIVEMINLIKKISHQTNMLAINASIEAAHAGQKGQGFAVVADEIRILSESSSEVTKKINDIVQVISKELEVDQTYSKSAKEGIESINQAFSKNINFINLLADSINQQIDSVDEMKVFIEKIHELSKNIKDSNDIQQKTTQEIYEATETLNSQSFLITQLVVQQKSTLENIINSLDVLNEIIKDTNSYTLSLPNLIKSYRDNLSK